MTILTLHDKNIGTVFDLLGQTENDLTFSLGWALARVPDFLNRLGRALGVEKGFSERVRIRLQQHTRETGVTDIEIDDPGEVHVILEAKRGFTVPSELQLGKYANRLKQKRDKPKVRLLVVLAEDDREGKWLQRRVPPRVNNVAIKSISWRQLIGLAKSTKPTHHLERHLLDQFALYLGTATTMQNQNSNLVYVVALSRDTFRCGEITFIDVVERYRQYFHPIGGVGGGWPYDPPNYLGVRYDGELKGIFHIETYQVIDNFKPHFTSISVPTDKPHFLYKLGPLIKPAGRVPTNASDCSTIHRARRVSAYLDLLLTAGSIAEAERQTRMRDERVSE